MKTPLSNNNDIAKLAMTVVEILVKMDWINDKNLFSKSIRAIRIYSFSSPNSSKNWLLIAFNKLILRIKIIPNKKF